MYNLIKENSGKTVAVQLPSKGKLELIILTSTKLHLASHKENLRFENVAETTFCQWKANIAYQ